ncbi:hypothetical protein CEUSTIGMA_g10282.t1 [Chlamydomonas eustigma]|uniref:RING-Gid-type domain-containing protein n=1 Tax=Chlamydomonas eustigma TaxID=1157962 RepID=A0A250XIL2_9CHLO|nr:hypothetical protein CEUSTIGMA_g10282.t1 [Chlamydomonas eustigma]|eukprot:GAX82856.1 hypothetical protein CEUSTIGMA_g10282.t1 [Chlamydomonas eustigma]
MSLETVVEEAKKVSRRQGETQRETEKVIQNLQLLIEDVKARILNGESVKCVLERVGEQLGGELKKAVTQTKDLHSAIGKLGKALEKAMDLQLDICKAYREIPIDHVTLNKVIAEHFFREGRFEVGTQFAAEACVQATESLKLPYTAMHSILLQIKGRNLQPALEWALEHRKQLSSDGSPSSFEFRLHSLNFIATLKTSGQQAALSYAKLNFESYQHQFMPQIQRLMGCLLYHDKPLAAVKYRDLLSVSAWDEIAAEFMRQACSMMGQACESPLAVTIAAGTAALPPLFKLVAVMERNSQDLMGCEQLPVELELGNEFVFHSIFACPVSREQSTPDNPPMLLPCNHVLCEQSVMKIAKNRNRIFKCPYCPVEARADNLRPLIFPNIE